MNLALGLVLIATGLGATLFTDRILRFFVARQRYQWAKDLMGSDLYSLFFWLGGVGFIFVGGIMIFIGIAHP